MCVDRVDMEFRLWFRYGLDCCFIEVKDTFSIGLSEGVPMVLRKWFGKGSGRLPTRLRQGVERIWAWFRWGPSWVQIGFR